MYLIWMTFVVLCNGYYGYSHCGTSRLTTFRHAAPLPPLGDHVLLVDVNIPKLTVAHKAKNTIQMSTDYSAPGLVWERDYLTP